MPLYEYRHKDQPGPDCDEYFTVEQSMRDDSLTVCPRCGAPVARQIGLPSISTPQTNADLKNLGFTKLVKRETGVYENVTATSKESRYMKAGDSSTLPDLKSKISD